MGDQRWTERKIALGKDLKPCAFFADNVFYRAVIDFTSIEGCQAMIVDYKTGKKKTTSPS
jgi:hypothetical protein